MKRILLSVFVVFSIFEMVVVCGAAFQPRSLGYVNFSYSSSTVAAICASTPTTVGYPIWCTNCAAGGGSGTVCTSTMATATAGCAFVLSTGTICK